MKHILIIAMSFMSHSLFSETLHFACYPSLSPNAGEIYFSYEGDIFRVGVEGGTAMRLVSLGGYESYPKVSPDGKYLAFSSDVNGNNDVYIVPVEGGEVKRLTWHEGSDTPSGWSHDSKYVYFESNRANIKTTYKVSVNGGTPVRLAEGYFNTMINVTENPVTGEMYFNEKIFRTYRLLWKRYMANG